MPIKNVRPTEHSAIKVFGQVAQLDAPVIIIEGDCLDVLPQLPMELIDLTVMDPPYESLERHRKRGTTTRLKHSKASSNDWFTIFQNIRYWDLFAELYRVQQNNSHCYMFCDSETEHVVLSGTNPYDKALDSKLQQYGELHGWNPAAGWTKWPTLSWVKIKQDSTVEDPEELTEEEIRMGMGYHWRRCDERILFLEKGKRKLNCNSGRSVFLGEGPPRKGFPTQKPECTLGALVTNSSNEGNIILDPFAGSGSTGRAALARQRRTILIDVDISWMVEHPIHPEQVVIRREGP